MLPMMQGLAITHIHAKFVSENGRSTTRCKLHEIFSYGNYLGRAWQKPQPQAEGHAVLSTQDYFSATRWRGIPYSVPKQKRHVAGSHGSRSPAETA